MSICMECSEDFQINEGEREFFAMRNLSLPKRCKSCRDNRKHKIRVEPTINRGLEPNLSEIYCDNCGRDAKVPFKPSPNRKAYCRVCWNGVKNVGVAAEFI